jgi:sulfate transport system ATP-binding protein
VFQNYALFRHMTVAENVEFALTVRRRAAAERRKRREELLDLVGLGGLGNRLPSQLSGGQQQRVALARALAHEPAVLLLDEPFGALDAPIRAELRRSLLEVHRALGVTTIFVTHDQEEAFELGDRVGVMRTGRLLEVGPPKELYVRPQTEYVATFLGVSNLLVGTCDADGVKLGDVRFPLGTEATASGTRRVQVLFRPEDVAVRTSPEALHVPLLGRAVVEETTFVGSTERLRLRLPLPGVRPISPAVPFGEDGILVDAMRSQDQARRYPLDPGDPAWIGVRRIHALPHRLRLVVADERPGSRSAVELGAGLAHLAHARLSVLSCGEEPAWLANDLRELRDRARGALASLEVRHSEDSLVESILDEASRRHFDLIVQGMPTRTEFETIERQLESAEHHLLLVPTPCALPRRALICVAVGEPGKEDVRFAGRLLRHLSAEATIACVVPEGTSPELRARADRFLARGQRALALLDVPARTLVRTGSPREEILDEVRGGDHDLLVVGAPLADRRGEFSLEGFIGDLLAKIEGHPVLIVRSPRN